MREGFAPETIDFNVRRLSFRSLVKVPVFFLHVLIYLTLHSVLFVLIRNSEKRLKIFLKSNAFHARLVLKYLGVEIFSRDLHPELKGQLIICNHISYIDVLVLFAFYPSLFITSREIRNTPFLGQITNLAGCFFVERRKHLRTPDNIQQELRAMKMRLDQGFNIFLFPEGTSSDGRSVLPFKAHFFQLATAQNLTVKPLVLRYHGASRSDVPWYGEMGFLPHFLHLTSHKNISVSLESLDEIRPGKHDHFQLKDEVYEKIRKAYETN